MDTKKAQSFSFRIGGLGLTTRYDISKDNLTLTETNINSSNKEKTKILETWDLDKWNAFMSKISNCNVSSWISEYNNIFIIDGTQWHLNITGDFKEIKSSGSNAYPNEWKDFVNTLHHYIDPEIS